MSAGPGPVVVGIVPDQPAAVLQHGARLAGLLGVGLHLVYVDPARYPVTGELGADPTVELSAPIDPDGDSVDGSPFDRPWLDRLDEIVRSARPAPVRWRAHVAAGEPARALARFGDQVDAGYLVIGSRERRSRSFRDFFGGSVAVHLAHHQSRPVVVVPVAPLAPDEPLDLA